MSEYNAIVSFQGRPTPVVEAVMKKVVSNGTENNYATHNIELLL